MERTEIPGRVKGRYRYNSLELCGVLARVAMSIGPQRESIPPPVREIVSQYQRST